MDMALSATLGAPLFVYLLAEFKISIVLYRWAVSDATIGHHTTNHQVAIFD